jgi:hypothetical protein
MYYGNTLPMDLLGILFAILFIGIWVGVIIFWIWMLVDAIKRPSEGFARLPWILLIVLSVPLGAIIYYFAVKAPADKKKVAPANASTQTVTKTETTQVTEQK